MENKVGDEERREEIYSPFAKNKINDSVNNPKENTTQRQKNEGVMYKIGIFPMEYRVTNN